MRHGYHSPNIGAAVSPSKFQILGSELGCYFCNDITAPGNVSSILNTMKPLSIDQILAYPMTKLYEITQYLKD